MLPNQTADSRQQTADSRQQTADSRQQTDIFNFKKVKIKEGSRGIVLVLTHVNLKN